MSDKPRLSVDSDERKTIPLASGCLDYFPDALAAVAALSFEGNQKHNPGQPLHWARGKSTDEADCLLRHFVERGTIDTDGIRHSAKVAWRALALLQKELEVVFDLPISRGSREGTPEIAAREAVPRTIRYAELRIGDRVRVTYTDEALGTTSPVVGNIQSIDGDQAHLNTGLSSWWLQRVYDDVRTITLLERAP